MDGLVAKYGLEKIKTIGDAYMVGGGVPDHRSDHAQAVADFSLDLVEAIPMPDAVIAWVSTFIETHHEDEVFIKRKRSKKFDDPVEDGVGDPRIKQATDVYRAPNQKTEFVH